MSPRPVLQWPDPRLQKVAEPVQEITDDIRAIWNEMVEVMEAMPGVGLAAPQLGIMLRLAIVDASEERGKVIRVANPEIIDASGILREHEEASPCLPGVSAKIKRPRGVSVRFLNEQGVVDRRDLVGLWATSVQHQIDHLNGRMYFDNLSKLKRDMLIKKARRLK
ncbi:MAG: peptide deformylase [Paracoccaceae bacterium]|nr:peptide deformylase [Paracoccaceae bacterium]